MDDRFTGATAPSAQLALNELMTVLDRMEYRRIVTAEDFEAVGVLRRDAFNARALYTEKFTEPVLEDLDYADESYVFGLYHDGTLVSSMRLNVLAAGLPETPALKLCRSTLAPLLAQGMVFIDPTRFAVDAEASRAIPALPLLTHRLSTMMTIYRNADHCLCVVKATHEAYYRRVFGATRLAGPFVPEGMIPDTLLLAISRGNQDYITRRNPIFNFTQTEARLLFDDRVDALPPLSVLPTARFAARAA
ncbi:MULTISPECIES: hypothetical protein [unclassified Roseitalea]|uniref:N-acyl amino acid synthase FeeM domain-containing protein n=1 Tax=unclassified Roseitalea TaxID=2639107 RepID=UPI00273ED400|nr:MULTISPECIES: hypothetical protein [unclassified Roseitalea]